MQQIELYRPVCESRIVAMSFCVPRRWVPYLTLQEDYNNVPLVKEKNGGLKKWFNEYNEITISEDFCMQLSLYLYLRNVEMGLFVIALLGPKDNAQP